MCVWGVSVLENYLIPHIEFVQHAKASRHGDRFWDRNAYLQLCGISGGGHGSEEKPSPERGTDSEIPG